MALVDLDERAAERSGGGAVIVRRGTIGAGGGGPAARDQRQHSYKPERCQSVGPRRRNLHWATMPLGARSRKAVELAAPWVDNQGTLLSGDPNRMRQRWESSSDAGKTWTVASDGVYVRMTRLTPNVM